MPVGRDQGDTDTGTQRTAKQRQLVLMQVLMESLHWSCPGGGARLTDVSAEECGCGERPEGWCTRCPFTPAAGGARAPLPCRPQHAPCCGHTPPPAFLLPMPACSPGLPESCCPVPGLLNARVLPVAPPGILAANQPLPSSSLLCPPFLSTPNGTPGRFPLLALLCLLRLSR